MDFGAISCRLNLILFIFFQNVSSSLDVGMKESLNELVYKSLVKLCKQPEPPLESIDDTVLK